MFWHIVRFDFSRVDFPARAELEDQLRGLVALDEVAWLRLGHDVTDPGVTGFVTAFADRDAYEAYREHPDHVPVVAAIQGAGVTATRIDFGTDDDVVAWADVAVGGA